VVSIKDWQFALLQSFEPEFVLHVLRDAEVHGAGIFMHLPWSYHAKARDGLLPYDFTGEAR